MLPRMDFSRTRFSVTRPLGSYTKVQTLVSSLIRSRGFQLKSSAAAPYLNVGCGPNVHRDFLNIDHQWRPGVVCWDITGGLPVASGSARGAFLEHCLEHLPLPKGYALLQEIYRTLRPDGIARVVVPDGQLYVETYTRFAQGARFPYQDEDGFLGRYTPMMSVNRVFYVQREELFGHNFIYDFDTLAMLLREAGFREVRRVQFREGADPMLLIDSESRRRESLYVEAVR
jgi:predicted SAM-dependent methyltransferase